MSTEQNWQHSAWQQSAQQQPAPTPPGAAYGAPVPPAPQQPAPKKSHGWIVAIVAIIAVFGLLAIGMASCASAFSSVGSLATSGTSSVSSADMLATDAVGIINIDGTIQYDGTTSSPEGLKEQLDVAASNSHIKAVVLRVNSGGGSATASEEMTEYLKEFMAETGKPVVVSSASSNASGAYELSSQADYIFTAKTTSIGAIGTAMQLADLSDLLDMLGISVENITSSDSKDSTYGTRELTDEERAYYQAMVDQINETFIETVAEGRGMTVDEVRTLATGLTFTGMDAVENGLADEIGTLEDAVAKAAELAGTSTTQTVTLEETTSDLSSLLSLMSTSTSISASDIVDALKELESDGSISN